MIAAKKGRPENPGGPRSVMSPEEFGIGIR
jgi:hypothetical protein